MFTKFALLTFVLLAGLTQQCLSQQSMQMLLNQIKISPLRLIDEFNPGLELSYERIYANKFSTQIAIGYMKPLVGISANTDYNGWRYGIEEKYFINLSTRERSYWSFDAVYLKVNYNNEGIFQQDTALNSPEYKDTYHINKRTFAFNINRGMQIPLNHFVVDLSLGIGIKYKMTERTGLEDIHSIESTSRHPNFYDMANRVGNYFTISIPLNVRIGYQF